MHESGVLRQLIEDAKRCLRRGLQHHCVHHGHASRRIALKRNFVNRIVWTAHFFLTMSIGAIGSELAGDTLLPHIAHHSLVVAVCIRKVMLSLTLHVIEVVFRQGFFLAA